MFQNGPIKIVHFQAPLIISTIKYVLIYIQTPLMIFLGVLLLLNFQFILISTKTITITWSTPDSIQKPSIGQESLKAIQTHLQALQLAQSIPHLLNLQSSLQIKLCPPQPYDPLIEEFTIPRLTGYSSIYDHECITEGMEAKWGWKPKKPEPQPQPPSQQPPSDHFKGVKGLTVPAFIFELLKGSKETETKQIWMLDSDSLRGWLTAPILNHLHNPKASIPPSQLMSQINTMYGTIGEKDLKNMPQAIQGALLLVLPDYSAWKNATSLKTFFNPTWWKTRYIPRSKESILNLLKNAIEKARHSDQLIIIHHDPTPFNFNLIKELTAIYNEKNLISSTKVLPKSATTLQLLQFIQKAAEVVVESRDTLGQVALLATGFSYHVTQFQDILPYSTMEMILITLLTTWFLAILITGIYFTNKYYDVTLHEHAKRFALFSILALAPIYAACPALWPKTLSMAIYTMIEAGYEIILYGIVSFYSAALLLTFAAFAYKKYKNKPTNNTSDEEDGLFQDDTDTIRLIPK